MGAAITAATTFLNTDVMAAIVAVGAVLIILAATSMGFRWVTGMFR